MIVMPMQTIRDRMGNLMQPIDLGDGRVQLISDATGETYVFKKEDLE